MMLLKKILTGIFVLTVGLQAFADEPSIVGFASKISFKTPGYVAGIGKFQLQFVGTDTVSLFWDDNLCTFNKYGAVDRCTKKAALGLKTQLKQVDKFNNRNSTGVLYEFEHERLSSLRVSVISESYRSKVRLIHLQKEGPSLVTELSVNK